MDTGLGLIRDSVHVRILDKVEQSCMDTGLGWMMDTGLGWITDSAHEYWIGVE